MDEAGGRARARGGTARSGGRGGAGDRLVQGREEDQELGCLGRPSQEKGTQDALREGEALRHLEETLRPGERPGARRAAGNAPRFGHQGLQVVDRLRDDGPRLRRLERLQGLPALSRREARPPLQRLGEDGAGEGRLRLHLARPAGARDGGDGREALDLPLLRQPRVGQRLPPRHAREAGHGEPRGVCGVAALLHRVRGTLQGRGGRMGDLERALPPGSRVRRALLPHREGHPRRAAEREVLRDGDQLDVEEGADARPERLRRAVGAPEEGERPRPREPLHLPPLREQPRQIVRESRGAAARVREELFAPLRHLPGRGGLPVAARIRPRDPQRRMDGVLPGEVEPAPHDRRRGARHPVERLHVRRPAVHVHAPELRPPALQSPQGGCLPSPELLRDAARLLLLRRGRPPRRPLEADREREGADGCEVRAAVAARLRAVVLGRASGRHARVRARRRGL